MTTNKTDNLLDWLRDAHGMEQQAEQMLKAQAARIEHYPDLKTRIEQHIQETLGQQAKLESCIARLGGTPSTVKDMTGKLMAFGQAAVGMMASDEVVKGSMSGYVFENLEIASYTVLIAAAEAAGDFETKLVCEEILQEEVNMARWMLENLPLVTQKFLARDEREGVAAKR
jgi:ferritin-like metal-binding protein YciE